MHLLLLALWVLSGKCEVLYQATGSEVSLACGVSSNSNVEWKFNNNHIISVNGRSGTSRHGTSPIGKKVTVNGDILKVPRLESSDSGDYVCTQSGKRYSVRVVSVFVKTGPVLLESSDAELHCNIGGDSETQVEWLRGPESFHASNGVLHLKSVTPRDEGQWICVVHNLQFSISLTVVGLQTKDVEVPEGGNAVLPCSLSHPVSQRVLAWKWKAEHLLTDPFPKLKMTEDNGLQWHGLNSKEVRFTGGPLSTNFDVELMEVQKKHEGSFLCIVEFESKIQLTATSKLTVLMHSVMRDVTVIHGTNQDERTFTSGIFGLPLWVWITVGVSSVILIGLFILTLFIRQRSKRMKTRMRKLRSMRQPLTAKDYCQCNRAEIEMQLGLREKQLPAPRHQYKLQTRTGAPNQYD